MQRFLLSIFFSDVGTFSDMPIGSGSDMYKIKRGNLLIEALTGGRIDCDRWKFLKIQVQSKGSSLRGQVCR